MIAVMLELLLILALASPLQVTPTNARGKSLAEPAPAPAGPPNIVVILADDFGVDLMAAYGESPTPPCTPNLDELASQGLLFRNAWANPSCSPTRAALLTGRHGFRTGIGSPLGGNAMLPLIERTLPEMLVGYDSAVVGKWHLGNQQGNHPNNSGFTSFAGVIGGSVPSYTAWNKTTNGVTIPVTTYATTDTADEAIASIVTMQEPWFLYANFNAPHTPLHTPPAGLCPPPRCPSSFCGSPGGGPPARGKAMVEAMDTEIGRVLTHIDDLYPDAWVFFLGDNGTSGMLSEPPFASNHAKGSVYEGGVNVPFIVRGPGVARGECAGLISVTDVFATLADLAGADASSADDSVSMVPYFSDPTLSLRTHVYAETFPMNGSSPPIVDHDRTVRDARYKLIRRTGQPDEFYDLALDPFEVTNLLPALSAPEQQAFDDLESELIALGVD